MKTKNLFFATALVASFASCTNDDIVEVQQGIANVERPTVENVKLNFVGEGTDSRVVYNGDYAWQSTDKIGALLMSNPRETPLGVAYEDEWINDYELKNFINTSYPFAYDAEAKVWGNDAKMLEGDYFFAHPWSAYEGERYLTHSLKNQTQTGVAGKVVAKDFADNQFFVGYSQIKKGTAAVDALTDVAMTPVLGGIQFRIVNNGSKTYHVNKIVVSGTGIATELTLDPTCTEIYADGFNYADYVGNIESDYATITTAKQWNAWKNSGERAAYLRSFVTPCASTTKIAELKVNGTKAERAIAKGKTGYAVVMLNEFTATNDLVASIYTDEGVVPNVKLTEAVYENADVLVDNEVAKVAYSVANTISIKFNDDAITTILTANIVDNDDLMHLIEWNAASDIKVYPVAKIVGKEVELTAEMFNLLKKNKNVTLSIEGTEALTLAADLPADVLEYEGLEITTPIVVANEIELTEDTQTIATMTIAEEGIVNIEEIGANIPANITNEGTLNVDTEAIVVFKNLTNEGTLNIVAGADVKGEATIVNNGKINNNGYLEDVQNNADAVIVLGAEAVLKALANTEDGVVETANGSYVAGTNEGLINFVTGAVLDEVTGNGMVAAVAPVTVTKDMYEETCINTLKLKAGQTTTFASGETGGIINIIAAEGATLKVAAEETLELAKFVVDAKTTIQGSVVVAEMAVAKNVKVYNYGVVDVEGTWSNKGIVYNYGEVYLPHGADKGTFKYTSPEFGDPTPDTSKADAQKEALEEWINVTSNPVNCDNFNAFLKAVSNDTYAKSYAYKTAYSTAYTLSETEYNTALAAIKTANTAALKTALLATTGDWTSLNLHSDSYKNVTLYAESGTVGTTNYKSAKTVAYDSFRGAVVDVVELTTVKKSVKLAASALSNDDVDAILAAKAPNAFIWEGCNLDLAVAVWKKHDGARLTGNAEHDYTASMNEAVVNTNTRFVVWVNAAIKDQVIATELSNAGVSASTLAHFSRYTTEQFKACAGL